MVAQFSGYLGRIPSELIVQVLRALLELGVADYVRFARSCRAASELAFGEGVHRTVLLVLQCETLFPLLHSAKATQADTRTVLRLLTQLRRLCEMGPTCLSQALVLGPDRRR